MSDRTVITGVGVASPLGIGIEETWAALSAAPSGGQTRVRAFDLEDYVPSKKPYLDRHSSLGLLAAALALGEGGIEGAAPDPPRSALAISTGHGNHGSLEVFYRHVHEKGIRLASPMIFPHTYLNATASLIAIEFGLRGEHLCFCDGPTGAAHALWFARRAIQTRGCCLCLAGAVDYPPELAGDSRQSEAAAFVLVESEGARGPSPAGALCDLADVRLVASGGNGAAPEGLLTTTRDADSTEAIILATTHRLCSKLRALPWARDTQRIVDMESVTGDIYSARLPFAVATGALCLSFGESPPALQAGRPTTLDGPPTEYIVVDESPFANTLVRLKAR